MSILLIKNLAADLAAREDSEELKKIDDIIEVIKKHCETFEINCPANCRNKEIENYHFVCFNNNCSEPHYWLIVTFKNSKKFAIIRLLSGYPIDEYPEELENYLFTNSRYCVDCEKPLEFDENWMANCCGIEYILIGTFDIEIERLPKLIWKALYEIW